VVRLYVVLYNDKKLHLNEIVSFFILYLRYIVDDRVQFFINIKKLFRYDILFF